jgi:DNA-binding XRE family transcriptional regulator
MRKPGKLPRILKINWVKDLNVAVVFNNGQSRVIDFKKLLMQLKVNANDPDFILFDPDALAKVELVDHTLSWSNVEQFITRPDGTKVKVPYELGADLLYRFSKPEADDLSVRIGWLIREARRRSGLTQQQLASRSGTTRNYISRIENDRSDIELDTLKKIIEVGLGKKLEIRIV